MSTRTSPTAAGPSAARAGAISVVENVVCSFCGCLCDDIVVEVDDGRIARVRKVCANGRGLFTHYDPATSRPTVDGREVSWEEAIAEAAQILDRADR
jgi:formylmethanofuran dehydrogenase subunit B